MAKFKFVMGDEFKALDGKPVEVIRTITEPEFGYDADVLPMHLVRFEDGLEMSIYPDELDMED